MHEHRPPQSKEGSWKASASTWVLLVSQLVNFTLLVVLLYLLLYKPVLRMLHERKERIARSMADVDAAREAAAKAQQEYDRKVAEAQRKAQEIIAQAAQTGEKVGAEIEADAQREAEAIRQKAREEAAAEARSRPGRCAEPDRRPLHDGDRARAGPGGGCEDAAQAD